MCPQARAAAAQAEFDAAMAQKQALAADAAATKARMDAANALLGALAGEEARWTAQSQAFDDQILRLTGAPMRPACMCALPADWSLLRHLCRTPYL